MLQSSRIIVALDYANPKQALALVERLDTTLCRLKVGKELFAVGGPALVEQLVAKGFDVFLDLKYHDIPNTVAMACKAAANMGVWMLNVHAQGGPKMMMAAKEALVSCGHQPLLIAVTILTSFDETQLHSIGLKGSVQDNVLRLASLTQQSGLDGVVCSAQEASLLRQHLGSAFCLVTPGIRPSQATTDDQQRVMTPLQALQAGSDYLVIGRPITQADDPLLALNTIHASIEGF
ncbi:MAG: orotidine-5'-phosphate decarboxylase [Thiomicrospira sp.]|jgi:orotidine-5'-phosphate decarboxylase|nr:orotidine-5'-phosphate decarboxylase [Thiomicrospira sp.]